MAFAELEDVEARIGNQDDAAVESLLAGATAMIAEAAGKDDAWAVELEESDDGVPGPLKELCIQMATRTLANPEGLDSQTESLGQYSHTARFNEGEGSANSIFLSKDEELMVRRVILGATSGDALTATILDQLPEWDPPSLPFPFADREDEEAERGPMP